LNKLEIESESKATLKIGKSKRKTLGRILALKVNQNLKLLKLELKLTKNCKIKPKLPPFLAADLTDGVDSGH